MGNVVYRYSEAFKHQVVRELESGSIPSITAAQKKYGITGTVTIKSWLKRYGRRIWTSPVSNIQKNAAEIIQGPIARIELMFLSLVV